jgi:putative heme-binding domain-containing protein
VYSDIQTIADHRHRSAHGGARVYLSDAFPASQQGRIFMANIHEHAVLSDVLERRGSGFSAHHGDDFLMANNAQWIGFSLEIGPDGALYVLDWHDADICGMEVLRKETGRVFRIAPKQTLAENWPDRYSDLRAMADAQLVDLQTSRSDWHARRARIILQHRASTRALQPDTHDRLRRLFATSENPDWRLRAMWGLHVTGGFTEPNLVSALDDRDEHVRAWAIQLLTEDRSGSPAAVGKFTDMARSDTSAIVRLYLASALQRMEDTARGTIAAALMLRGEDAKDHNIPNMLWFGIEPLVKSNPSLALERASRSNIPMLARFTARRSVDADALEPVISAIAAAPKTQASLLEGLRDGLEGRVDVSAPSNWARVFSRLRQSGDRIAQLAAEVERQFDNTEAARQNLATVRNRTAPVAERQHALRILAAQRRPQLASELPAALEDERVRLEAIRAVAAYDDDALGKALIERYPSFSPAEKREAIQTLSSRRRYGRLLTDALAQKAISRTDVPPYAARQLRRVVGTPFTEVWGPVEQVASEERAFTRYRGLLNDATLARADAANGKAVYERTCGACHKLNGEGGAIGPDLTGSNRTNIEYLLFNVLNPNGEVQDAYKAVVITTRDGRTFSGTVASETDRQVTLRVVDRDAVAINKADIQSRETTNVSMMPVGLFDALTDREVIDLVGYLRMVR